MWKTVYTQMLKKGSAVWMRPFGVSEDFLIRVKNAYPNVVLGRMTIR
jgi:hypothetical protein